MSTIPHLPIFLEDDGIEQGSRIILKLIRPDWNLDKIRYKLFTDGITNKLVGLFDDSRPEDDGVLVRVYGKNTEQIIDRKAEFENFKFLYHAGLAPDLYATFDNGMVYKYIKGETLNTSTVREPSIYRLVATTMARFHRLGTNGISARDGTIKSELWNKMEQFANLIPKRFSSPSNELRFRKIFTQGIENLRADIEPLKALLENIESPVVFCHNDLLLGNILLQSDDTVSGRRPVSVAFIDYEYAMFNNQAFDIANHFIEFAGVQEPDFSLYPNVDLQMDWLKSYLEEYTGESLDQNDQKIAVLKHQVDMFTIASHLLWIFWSLVQTEISVIDFDYLRYAEMRLEQYTKAKSSLIK
ncbi:ethanolamine kinase [Rhopalosiphum maidis]|uniref:ethanolamine kinase n=1 Tax=Rhopalosiphum maidis TaxID=43146 RepID=UPI000EFFC22C|nr:ethanolamine kinase [Rhopalosiphum maidis]XP_026820063.1 ethanolamine kinase [Rhopalosiphum maidis]XP_028044386.1 ethanolamine kinase [Rhopalosiphum maidis]